MTVLPFCHFPRFTVLKIGVDSRRALVQDGRLRALGNANVRTPTATASGQT